MKNILINDWIDYLESIKDNSSNTIKSYEFDVINFLQFIKYRFNLVSDQVDIYDLSGVPIDDIDENFIKKITSRDIISYISYTDKYLNNSSSTRSRKLSSLRSFFNYLHKIIFVIDNDPISTVQGPKLSKRLPIYLQLSEVKKLLDTILEVEDDFYRIRDFAIVMMFLNTGMRLSELVNLKTSDFDNDSSIRIIGKGNKERFVYMNSSTKDAISNYMEIRPDTEIENIFVNKKGTEFLGQRGIQYLLKKYIKKAGLNNNISPHKLRHTAATLLYKYGDIDIRTLQVILGHESVATTQIYTHVDSKQIKEAVELNPIKNLNLKNTES